MSGAVTNGFDMVVRLTESAISDGLEMLPAPGRFPLALRRQVTLTVQGNAVPYDTLLELERPSVTLDATNKQVTVRCDLGPSSELSAPPTVLGLSLLQQVPITGFVEFTCPTNTEWAVVPGPRDPSSGRAVVAKLTDSSTVTAFTVSSVTIGTAAGVGVLTIAPNTLQPALLNAFAGLAAMVDDVPLTTPIPIGSGPTPVRRVSNLRARILPGAAGERPSLGLGVLTEASEGLGLTGNIDAINAIQGLAGGAVHVANAWLIQLVAETLEQSPGFLGVNLEVHPDVPDATFSGSVQVDPPDGDAFTLKRMTVELADGGGVRISGEGEMSGFCWSADFDFNLVLSFSCNPANGALTATASEPDVNADASISWLCAIVVGAIVGIIVGALTAWIVGVVVGLVTAIILKTIDIGLPDLPISTIPGLFNAFGGIRLPLPIGTAGLLIETCSFDDLAVVGTPVYVDLSPRQATGLMDGPASIGFDLDTGTTGSPAGAGIDVAWLGTELQRGNGCELRVMSGPLDRLSLSDLQALSYGTASIPASQIPTFTPPPDLPWPFPDLPPLLFAGAPLVVAARTSEGRYAKLGLWRRITDNALFISFETYASPVVSLSLEAFVHTTKHKVVDRGEERCFDVIVDPVLGADALDLLRESGMQRPSAGSSSIASPGRRRLASNDVARPPVVGPIAVDPTPGHRCGGYTTVHAEEVAFFVSVERSLEVVVRAIPTLLAAPIRFDWSVFGTSLSGSGRTDVQGLTVDHDETSPRLVMTSPLGTDVVGQVCVQAIDAVGRDCDQCIKLDLPGRVKLGGCWPCAEPTTLDGYLVVADKLDRWSAGASVAGLRLRGLAVGVKVPPTPGSRTLRDALLKVLDKTGR
jgi:hypothetical protein